MKNTILIIISITIFSCSGQKTYVPDDNFERELQRRGYDTGELDDYVLSENIKEVTSLRIRTSSIKDLTGIEGFVSLKELYCSSNQLSHLDVSKNKDLLKLYCSSNQLSHVDVSKNTALKELDCSSNQLSHVDVSKNKDLLKLYCYENQLIHLDVSKNTALTELYCAYNQLSRLDVSKNTALTRLDCSSNQLSRLDVSKNKALAELSCYENQLTHLDISKNKALNIFRYYNRNSKDTILTELKCTRNQLGYYDISKYPHLINIEGEKSDEPKNEEGIITIVDFRNGESYSDAPREYIQDSLLIDSLRNIAKTAEIFIKWYINNNCPIGQDNLFTFSESLGYHVFDSEYGEYYLNELKNTGVVSDSLLRRWRGNFAKMEAYMENKKLGPETDGVIGYEADIIFNSQDLPSPFQVQPMVLKEFMIHKREEITVSYSVISVRLIYENNEWKILNGGY